MKLDLEYQVRIFDWITLTYFQKIMIVLIFFLGKEHWIGLNTIHKLTNQAGRQMQLKITLEKFTGETAIVYYDTFIVGDKVHCITIYYAIMYTLHVISLKFTGNPCKFCMYISKN